MLAPAGLFVNNPEVIGARSLPEKLIEITRDTPEPVFHPLNFLLSF